MYSTDLLANFIFACMPVFTSFDSSMILISTQGDFELKYFIFNFRCSL